MVNVERKVEELVKKYKIPSMSVAVLSEDKIVFQSCYGVRKSGENDKTTKMDSFHLGSCGKSFTATLTLKLQDEGKLNIEDRIVKYLEKLDSSKFEDIKIKHLLSHTAGIDANVQGDTWEKMCSFDISASKARDLAIEYLNKVKRFGHAGTIFEYSNLGYMLLAQIIESIEMRTFECVLNEKLFEPFEMQSCTFGPAGRSDDSFSPWGHDLKDGKYIAIGPKSISSDNPPAMSPAGGISCNQQDWAKFIYYIMGVGQNSNYLHRYTREYLTKTNLDNYTYGAWGKFTRDWAGTLLVHAGSNTLNYSYIIIGLDKKFAFLVNTNSPCEDAVLEIVPYLKDFYLGLYS